MAIMAKAITLTNYAHFACTLVYTGSSLRVDSWHNGTKYDLRYLCLDLQISQTVYGGHDSKNMEWD